MIFRRYTSGHLTKLHLRLFSLHRVFSPWTSTIIRGGKAVHYLCPRIRGNEFRFLNANDENIETWLEKHAKGSFCIEVIQEDPTTELFPNNRQQGIKVKFTDPDSALMFKLQMGGR